MRFEPPSAIARRDPSPKHASDGDIYNMQPRLRRLGPTGGGVEGEWNVATLERLGGAVGGMARCVGGGVEGGARSLHAPEKGTRRECRTRDREEREGIISRAAFRCRGAGRVGGIPTCRSPGRTQMSSARPNPDVGGHTRSTRDEGELPLCTHPHRARSVPVSGSPIQAPRRGHRHLRYPFIPRSGCALTRIVSHPCSAHVHTPPHPLPSLDLASTTHPSTAWIPPRTPPPSRLPWRSRQRVGRRLRRC